MGINSITSIAQAGIQGALGRFETSARRVAQSGDPAAGVELEQEVVSQLNAKQEVSANISVLRTADEMMGQLLDIKV
ncbi:MAG: flagellar hook protein FlgE [Caulobacteraceae bacterium]|nr:MAG: flagellar hook protein FlgE [Caulobacteraceae bacterium]